MHTPTKHTGTKNYHLLLINMDGSIAFNYDEQLTANPHKQEPEKQAWINGWRLSERNAPFNLKCTN